MEREERERGVEAGISERERKGGREKNFERQIFRKLFFEQKDERQEMIIIAAAASSSS